MTQRANAWTPLAVGFASALAALFAIGCGDDPVSDVPEVTVDRLGLEGLWGGVEQEADTARIACLKLFGADSLAQLEIMVVDTLAGSGIILRGEGSWTHRPPRLEVALERWPQSGDPPRVTGEHDALGNVLLLRVSRFRGDQFAMGLTRLNRCGRLTS